MAREGPGPGPPASAALGRRGGFGPSHSFQRCGGPGSEAEPTWAGPGGGRPRRGVRGGGAQTPPAGSRSPSGWGGQQRAGGSPQPRREVSLAPFPRGEFGQSGKRGGNVPCGQGGRSKVALRKAAIRKPDALSMLLLEKHVAYIASFGRRKGDIFFYDVSVLLM
ncbi:uncharacterized protein WM294_015267 [Sarcoramphus papa]